MNLGWHWTIKYRIAGKPNSALCPKTQLNKGKGSDLKLYTVYTHWKHNSKSISLKQQENLGSLTWRKSSTPYIHTHTHTFKNRKERNYTFNCQESFVLQGQWMESYPPNKLWLHFLTSEISRAVILKIYPWFNISHMPPCRPKRPSLCRHKPFFDYLVVKGRCWFLSMFPPLWNRFGQ